MEFIFDNIKPPKLLVIGELILDINIIGTYTRFANESPVPVFKEESRTFTLGGASNVLHNLANLNCEMLTFMTLIGDDEYTTTIKNLLKPFDVIYIPYTGKNHVKTRYFVDNILQYRADVDEKLQLDFELLPIIKEKYDFIVISDYNKGFLTRKMIEDLKKYNTKLIVDPKNEIHKYNDIFIIKPNIKEIPPHMQEHIQEPINNCQISIITQSSKGITVIEKGKSPYNVCYDTTNCVGTPADTTGCGDMVLAVISYLVKSDIPLQNIVDLACYLATQSVRRVGCQTISDTDLMKYATIKRKKCLLTKDLNLFKNIAINIVFTNGCFDIFHHGHLKLLNFAKAQGDLLIVGLNSDDSIKRLKGLQRPINKLETRIELLQSLDVVDFVIVYDEDTPYNILKVLRPKIIVKGSDYNVNNVVGREFAREVKLFELCPSISTTKIVNNVLEKL
jgi:D-beta-D-heptose 7-phosphate kinase/D-beta-D-heptose 1-phosphate adenosyltransferase